jgi:2,4-dienoyl-CoA reductase-like NADH-dependent reductase (Old Yellow Enzyme family)
VNRRSAVVSGVACALSYGSFAHAAPPVIAQTEINYLLGFIERSGCTFYRNGSWYDASQAQAHLRSKYEALAGMGRIVTAEDFIEQAATKSSLSGEAYAIRCNSGPAVTTDHWLRDALARYRHAAG